MPVTKFVFAFFIMFGRSSMSVCRKFVLLRCFFVRVVHIFLPWNRNSTI